MSTGDDKVKITGQVHVEENAQAQLAAILGELKTFREQWASAAQDVAKTDDAVRETAKSSSLLGSVWTGIWQGVGQKLFQGVVGGLVSIGRSIVEQIDRANAFGDVFSRMTARGVQGVEELRAATLDLAKTMGTDLLATAELTERAWQLGIQGAEAFEVLRAAMRNEELEGYSAKAALEESTRVRKALNLSIGEQAEMIAAVAEASRKAQVDQGELYNLMQRSQAWMPRLGASWKDLLAVVQGVAEKGLLPTRQTMTALMTVMDQMIAPSDALSAAMQLSGVVSTYAGQAWEHQSAAAASLKTEVENLTSQINDLNRAQNDIARLGDEASRRVQRYQELTQKQNDGVRLNRLEREELKQLKAELKDYNRELGKYDEAARFVADSEFRKLSVLEQVEVRVKNLKLVQMDLSEESRRLQAQQDILKPALETQAGAVEGLAKLMREEMPGAVKDAIGEEGLAGFLGKLGESESVLASFDGATRLLLDGMKKGTVGLVDAIDGAAARQKDAWQGTIDAGYGAWEKLKAMWANLATLLAEPLSAFRDAFALTMTQVLGDDFVALVAEKGAEWTVLFEEWGRALGDELALGVSDVISGERTLGEVLGEWMSKAWEKVKEWLLPELKELGKALWNSLLQGLKDAYMDSDFNSWLSGLFKPLTDAMYGVGSPSVSPYSIPPDAPIGFGFPGDDDPNTWDPRPKRSMSQTINVYAADPSAAAREVMRLTAEQERLGW